MKVISFLLLANLIAFSSLSYGQTTFKVRIKGKGQPVIVLSCLGCKSEIWDPLLDKISGTYAFYFIEPLGHSAKTNQKYTVEEMGSEIANWIKVEKIKMPILLGHSFGGFLTYFLGAKNPTVFSKIIVLDAYHL